MPRLIDADALCARIENEFDGVCVYDVSGNEAAREFCDMVDVATTIDAIPVEWLKGLMLSTDDDVDKVEFAWIIREWQKEQEARA